MPVPQGIRISSFFSISWSVEREQTSNSLETRQRELQPWLLRIFVDAVLRVKGSGMEPTLVDPITGEPTTTDPVLGLMMVAGPTQNTVIN